MVYEIPFTPTKEIRKKLNHNEDGHKSNGEVTICNANNSTSSKFPLECGFCEPIMHTMLHVVVREGIRVEHNKVVIVCVIYMSV